jgi:hypothetical protein
VIEDSDVCLGDQNNAWDIICELLEGLALSLITFREMLTSALGALVKKF